VPVTSVTLMGAVGAAGVWLGIGLLVGSGTVGGGNVAAARVIWTWREGVTWAGVGLLSHWQLIVRLSSQASMSNTCFCFMVGSS
jgi:hypothetical protein